MGKDRQQTKKTVRPRAKVTPDTVIDCKPYACRMAAKWCIAYQQQAQEAAAKCGPMSEEGVWRIKCRSCLYGKQIAAAVKKSGAQGSARILISMGSRLKSSPMLVVRDD